MYKQVNKSGKSQYFLTLFLCLILWILCDLIGVVLKLQLLSDILFIISAAVVVYIVYVHYCAVFEYEINKKKLTVRRMSGKRVIKTEEIPFGRIDEFTEAKPDKLPKNTLYLTVSAFSKKKYCYLIYDKKTKCIVFEPDENIKDLLRRKEC